MVGTELIRHLLAEDYYQTIKVITRRKLNITGDRLQMIIIEDFDRMEDHREQMKAQDFYCALGTTIKKAGSKAMFEKIDLEYPKRLAAIAMTFPEFEQFLIVTATGSNAQSPLFYNQVKGRVEEELTGMGLPALKIFQPSFLLGHRDDFRMGEVFAKILTGILSFFMVGLKRGLFSIHGSDVAKAMLHVARQRQPGRQVFKSSEMFKLAKASTEL